MIWKSIGRALALGASIAVTSVALGYWARRKEAEAMFGSPRLVSAGLRSLGYDIKADVGPWREASQEEIARFQSDYNSQGRNAWPPFTEMMATFWGLPESGEMTPHTRMAMMFSLEQQSASGVPFLVPVIVPTDGDGVILDAEYTEKQP